MWNVSRLKSKVASICDYLTELRNFKCWFCNEIVIEPLKMLKKIVPDGLQYASHGQVDNLRQP
jgi:hypothetical protein